MKAFTSLMKLCITAVSIALVAMLVISALPIVMGGVDVQNEEPINLQVDGTYLHITGKYVVESSIEQDISDLVIEAYLVSKDKTQTMNLITVGPKTITKGQSVDIVLKEDIPMAELAVFFITDNMDNEEAGIKLPINIHVKGTYSNDLAGLDMNLVYEYEVSKTGQIKVDTSKAHKTAGGELSVAALTVTDVDSQLKALIPDEAKFSISIGSGESKKDLNLSIDKAGDDLALLVETGEIDEESISEVIHAIVDAVDSKSDEPITFVFNDETHEVNPSDIDSEEAQKYIEQVKGMMGSLDMFLDKYAAMVGGGA